MKPLADLVRPKKLSEVYGQQHILGENKILDRIVKSGRISNMIFYGPPGVGKTTVANIIAEKAGKRFYKLNATNASLKDCLLYTSFLASIAIAFNVDWFMLILEISIVEFLSYKRINKGIKDIIKNSQ